MPTVRTIDGSSNVATVGHDATTSELRVGFVNGDVYSYEGFSEEAYQSFMAAPSKGAYLQSQIRNQYAGRKVDAQFEDTEPEPSPAYRQRLIDRASALRSPSPQKLAEMIGVTAKEARPRVFRFEGLVLPNERAWLEQYRCAGDTFEFES